MRQTPLPNSTRLSSLSASQPSSSWPAACFAQAPSNTDHKHIVNSCLWRGHPLPASGNSRGKHHTLSDIQLNPKVQDPVYSCQQVLLVFMVNPTGWEVFWLQVNRFVVIMSLYFVWPWFLFCFVKFQIHLQFSVPTIRVSSTCPVWVDLNTF